VQLIEDQIRGIACEEEAAPICTALWRSVEASLAAAGTACGPGAGTDLGPGASGQAKDAQLASAFLDALLAPGRVSRRALHAALGTLGGGRGAGALPALEEVLQWDLEELRRLLPG
jgi:hypothetical protein